MGVVNTHTVTHTVTHTHGGDRGLATAAALAAAPSSASMRRAQTTTRRTRRTTRRRRRRRKKRRTTRRGARRRAREERGGGRLAAARRPESPRRQRGAARGRGRPRPRPLLREVRTAEVRVRAAKVTGARRGAAWTARRRRRCVGCVLGGGAHTCGPRGGGLRHIRVDGWVVCGVWYWYAR